MTDNEKLEAIVREEGRCTLLCEHCPIGDICSHVNYRELAKLMLERNEFKSALEIACDNLQHLQPEFGWSHYEMCLQEAKRKK